MRRGELSAAITQIMSKCLWSGWKWQKGYKEIASPFNCCLVNHEYSWNKSQKQKPKKANYALQHVRTESRCMRIKIVLNFSWRRSLLYRNQSIDLQNKSMDCFLFDMGFRIHWNTFLDCDKIIDICASKYQRRMLLINPLSKN